MLLQAAIASSLPFVVMEGRADEKKQGMVLTTAEDGWKVTKEEVNDTEDKKSGTKVHEEHVDRQRTTPDGSVEEYRHESFREEKGKHFASVSRVESYTRFASPSKRSSLRVTSSEEKKQEATTTEEKKTHEEDKDKDKEKEKKGTGEVAKKTEDGWTVTKEEVNDTEDKKSGTKVHEEHVDRRRTDGDVEEFKHQHLRKEQGKDFAAVSVVESYTRFASPGKRMSGGKGADGSSTPTPGVTKRGASSPTKRAMSPTRRHRSPRRSPRSLKTMCGCLG